MQQIRKRLTYANVMSTIAVFFVLGGASAIAANQLAKNSVGSKQLKKNAVTAAKIKKNAIGSAKIAKNAVTTDKIKDGAVTGAKINASTLGTVPSATNAVNATNATTASNLAGQSSFSVRLGYNQHQTVASNGAVSVVAECGRFGAYDVARLLMQTSVNGATGAGDWSYNGSEPSQLLNVDTPADDRVIAVTSTENGRTLVEQDIDEGFVLGPEGKGIVLNTEGVILAINYGAPGCLIAGVANSVG